MTDRESKDERRVASELHVRTGNVSVAPANSTANLVNHSRVNRRMVDELRKENMALRERLSLIEAENGSLRMRLDKATAALRLCRAFK